MTSADHALADRLVHAIDAAPTLDDALRATVSGLADSAERSDWVGIYLLDGATLVLHNEIGKPTPHTRIPLSQGLCGAAARERRTIVVDDVREDPRYLACSLTTRSELVVPILGNRGQVFGEIDLDSDQPAAFGPDARRLVETAAAALAARWDRV
ncbi:MAG TPA: GAF domain-containing protein [Methylomirabilota bacterium]|jgi:GAF domain-containing protein|nr:GAF domain-containing protein [Methylomirabilota bacterium]